MRGLGYDVVKLPAARSSQPAPDAPDIDPVWPLPRRASGLSDEQIRKEFARFDHWHYAYAFDGGPAFATSHNNPGLDTDDPQRPLQRFRHFMPYVLQSQGGSLEGKRVLDIACNSGFWSIQCALLGAHVVGFDARPQLVAQANLLKQIIGLENTEFQVLDFWSMTPAALGGTFDVVLNLGFLYHVDKTIEALERTRAMARRRILLDTAIHPSADCALHLKWETPFDIRTAADEGIVALPTASAVQLMLRQLGVKDWLEIPVRSRDLPFDYLAGTRASWLIEV